MEKIIHENEMVFQLSLTFIFKPPQIMVFQKCCSQCENVTLYFTFMATL